MATRDIPRSEWVTFFNNFTERYAGGLVDMDVLGPGNGMLNLEPEARELGLKSISADLKDGEDIISITVGRRSEGFIRHAIAEVSHVRLLQNDRGNDAGVEIESVDGITTVLRFHSAEQKR